MTELKRIINKKTIYVIMFILFMCITYFFITCYRNNSMDLFKAKNFKTDEYVSYIDNYHEYITNILNNAEKTKNISAFSDDNFTIDNIDKTYSDYKKLEEIKPVITNTTGFNEYILYIPFISISVFLIMLYCIFNVNREYDNGEIIFTYSCKNGRFLLSFRRNIIYTIMSIGLNIMFNLIIILLSGLLLGFPSGSAPVQSSVLFKDCTYILSVLGFYLLNIILTSLGICVLTMMANLLFILIKNKHIAIVLMGMLLFLQYRLSLLSGNNSINIFLSNINLFKMLDFSSFFRNYQNINILNRAIKSSALIIIIAAAVYFLLMIGSDIAYTYRHPFSKIKFERIKDYFESIEGLICSGYGFWRFELHKIFIRKKRIVFIIIFLILEFFLIRETKVQFPQRQIITDKIYCQYGGKDWNVFDKYLEEYRNEILSKKSEVNELQYEKNDKEDVQKNIREISRISSEISEMQKILDECEMVENRKAEINDQTGITIYAMSDRGYNEIFGGNSVIREVGIMIIMILIAVLIGAEYYQEEIQNGLINLLKTSKRGVKDIFANKMRVIMLSMLFIITTFLVIDYITLNLIYGFKYLDAPILSLNFMQKEINSVFGGIKIWQYLLIDLFLKILIPMLALMTSLMCSLKFKTLIFAPVIIVLTAVIGSLIIYAEISVKVIAIVIMAFIIFSIMGYIGRGGYGVVNK